MNTELIEALLTRLVEVNENILESIGELKNEVTEIRGELNWINNHSFASTLLHHINEASSKIDSMSEIAEELDWTKDLSFAKAVLDGIDNISSTLTSIDANTLS